jgi:hypothetical protein
VMRLGETGDPFGRGGEQCAVPGLAGPYRQADREVGLAGARRLSTGLESFSLVSKTSGYCLARAC